jgi:hypothetical protein
MTDRFRTLKTIIQPLSKQARPWESESKLQSDKGLKRLMLNDWKTIIEIYGDLELTKPTDKLVALSAVAKHWKALLQDEFLAGLWKGDLIYQLLWRNCQMEGKYPHRSAEYCAPTWSWASIDKSRIFMPTGTDRVQALHTSTYAATILEAHVEPVGQDETGQIRSGHIRLQTRLKHGHMQLGEAGYHALVDGPTLKTGIFPDIDLGEKTEFRFAYIIGYQYRDARKSQAHALMLEPKEGMVDTYERVGLLTFHGAALSWFDDCESQIITLV